MRKALQRYTRDFIAVLVLAAIGLLALFVILSQQSTALPSWFPFLGEDRFELKTEFQTAQAVTPRRLSISSGLGNLILSPFGALPMCHGAGGVAAHYRFGARTGGAPLMLGLLLLALALVPGGAGLALLGAIPAAGLGALLLVASVEMAASRRLWDCKPSCYPVIAATAARYREALARLTGSADGSAGRIGA